MVIALLLSLFSFCLPCLASSETELIERFIPSYAKEHLKSTRLEKLEFPHFEKDSQNLVARQDICEGDLLPLSKDQKKKTYHLDFTATFDRTIPGDSDLCQVRQRGGQFRCIVAKRFKAKLLSDTYRDSCGNLLRGYAWITYTLPGETMMDSVSPGRTLEVAERFNGAILYRAGEIEAVSPKRFQFFETYNLK